MDAELQQAPISSAALDRLSPRLTMLASALSVFLGVTVALASVVNVFERSADSSLTRCSTTISDADIVAAEKDFQPNLDSRSLTERASGSATIQVYFNVISADQTLAGGNLPFVYSSFAIRTSLA